jgi:pimeloyl-ACP methyl ester carboxylesterase
MAEEGARSEPRRRSVQCISPRGLHRIAYLEWGDPRNRDVVVCVHGLTRVARDFDDLARALCGRFRVLCPDMAGRGDSDRLADPALYGVPQYVSDCVALIARLDVEAVSWVGTSMGGLIGMTLAALPGTPVKRLVLNDIGPVVTKVSLERIGSYLGRAPAFPSIEKAVEYIRDVAAPFGKHTDEQWRFLTEIWLRKSDDGTYRAHYDPRIAEPFRASMPKADLEIWPVWEAIRCPTLVVRGARSDLLSKKTASQMTERGPKARLVEIPEVGHAPTLMDPGQISVVREFLNEGAEP